MVELRCKRLTQAHTAAALGLSKSTVGRLLARAGLSCLSDLQPAEPVVRYPRTTDPCIPDSAAYATTVSYTPQGHVSQETGTHWQRSCRYNASERLAELQQKNVVMRRCDRVSAGYWSRSRRWA